MISPLLVPVVSAEHDERCAAEEAAHLGDEVRHRRPQPEQWRQRDAADQGDREHRRAGDRGDHHAAHRVPGDDVADDRVDALEALSSMGRQQAPETVADPTAVDQRRSP